MLFCYKKQADKYPSVLLTSSFLVAEVVLRYYPIYWLVDVIKILVVIKPELKEWYG